MRIVITNFSGVSPYTPPRYLGEGQAQTALNCANWAGPLTSLLGLFEDTLGYFASDYVDPTYSSPTDNNLLTGVSANTIYYYGSQIGYRIWFHWDTDVDVARGFIAGDTAERTFFTGSGKPQSTDKYLNLGPGPYPANSYDLGRPLPVSAPQCTVSGTATVNAVPETRVYTYTWVNSWGDETAPYANDPMPASAFVDVSNGQTVNVVLPVAPVGNFNITSKRIYRSVSGTGGEVKYVFVAEIDASVTTYNDAVAADETGEVCPSITWQPPPENMIGLIGLPNGILAGFYGRDIYLSDPYHPFAWPIGYRQTVKNNVVGLGLSDTTICVLTDGRPVFIQGSHPDSMVMVEADVHQACVSKRSIVSMMGSVYYASPDGIVRLSPSGSEIVTKGLMTKAQWNDLVSPETIHAYMHERRYVAFYDSPTYGQGGFIIDFELGVFIFHNVYVEAGFNALELDRLFVAQSNYIKEWDAGAKLSYTWKSKKFTFAQDVGFSALRVDSEGAGAQCRIYRDGTKIFDNTVTARKMARLPAGRGRDWEIELLGTDEVFRFAMAGSPRELGDG